MRAPSDVQANQRSPTRLNYSNNWPPIYNSSPYIDSRNLSCQCAASFWYAHQRILNCYHTKLRSLTKVSGY